VHKIPFYMATVFLEILSRGMGGIKGKTGF
jgi:hypothetical protein